MVKFPRQIAYGLLTAALLCGTALVGPAGAAGQVDPQPPAAQKGPHGKPPVASPRTFSSPEQVEARAAELQQKLHITALQKPQWDKVVAAMRGNADKIDDVLEHRRANAGKMTALEDLRSYQTLSELHAEGLKNLVAAFEPLYASLSPEQKKAADDEFGGYRRRVSSREGAAPKSSTQ